MNYKPALNSRGTQSIALFIVLSILAAGLGVFRISMLVADVLDQAETIKWVYINVSFSFFVSALFALMARAEFKKLERLKNGTAGNYNRVELKKHNARLKSSKKENVFLKAIKGFGIFIAILAALFAIDKVESTILESFLKHNGYSVMCQKSGEYSERRSTIYGRNTGSCAVFKALD